MSFSKYGARKVEIDGILFDSRAEARRYQDLKLLQQAGEISGLELQPKYPLVVNGVKIGLYTADFKYTDCSNGLEIVEDVKGMRTRDYVLRKKLVKALYGIDILETGGRR